MSDKIILVVGTYDTKEDELRYMADRISSKGGGVLTMDVSVLGGPSQPCDNGKDQVAAAGGSSISAAIESGMAEFDLFIDRCVACGSFLVA